MFRKIIITFLFILAFNSNINAQFTIDDDTLLADGYMNAFELIAPTKIRNATGIPDTVVWIRTENTLPSNWTSAICDIMQCYSVTTSGSEFVLEPNTVEDMSFHFYPANTTGKAKMIVQFFKKSNPSYKVDVVIYSQGYGLGLNHQEDVAFKLYPNPANSSIFLENETVKEGTYEIYNSLGEKVINGVYEGIKKIDLSSFAKGIYFINLNNSNASFSRKFVIE